jgi:hypothetical protein
MRGSARKRAFGSALTAIATVAVMSACASTGSQAGTQAASTQSASTRASTTRASTPQEFVSKRYNFAVTLPQDWSEADALFDWDGKSLKGPGAPDFANFADPATGRTLMAAAVTVPTGTQLAKWQAAMVRATPPVCAESSSAQTTTLGGKPALAWTVKCSDGYDVNKLAALHGHRGYIIYLVSATANDDAEDRRIFDGIRESFRFTG